MGERGHGYRRDMGLEVIWVWKGQEYGGDNGMNGVKGMEGIRAWVGQGYGGDKGI